MDETARKLLFKVEGMACGGCAETVKQAIEKMPGVAGAEVDHAKGQALVTLVPGAQVTTETLVSAVEEAGYSCIPAE